MNERYFLGYDTGHPDNVLFKHTDTDGNEVYYTN